MPFTVTIPDQEKDQHLARKLTAKLSGILTWALNGCLDWQQHGLGEPEEVRMATDAYRCEQDTMAAFIAECCFAIGMPRSEPATSWMPIKYSGDKNMNPTSFGSKLNSKGYTSKPGTGGYKFYHGIGLPGNGESRGYNSGS